MSELSTVRLYWKLIYKKYYQQTQMLRISHPQQSAPLHPGDFAAISSGCPKHIFSCYL